MVFFSSQHPVIWAITGVAIASVLGFEALWSIDSVVLLSGLWVVAAIPISRAVIRPLVNLRRTRDAGPMVETVWQGRKKSLPETQSDR